MPAMLFHSMSLVFSLKSVGIFFVASPIISKLLTTALLSVSSEMNFSLERLLLIEIS
jgi:hypothetical protein